jgi:hypothetical protein
VGITPLSAIQRLTSGMHPVHVSRQLQGRSMLTVCQCRPVCSCCGGCLPSASMHQQRSWCDCAVAWVTACCVLLGAAYTACNRAVFFYIADCSRISQCHTTLPLLQLTSADWQTSWRYVDHAALASMHTLLMRLLHHLVYCSSSSSSKILLLH